MSTRITLEAIPNQSLSIRLGENLFDITIKDANGIAAVTIVRNGETIVSGRRTQPGVPLMPYRALENDAGNFVFLTDNGEYPNYQNFGGTAFLIYLTNEEIEAALNVSA